ncbi:MAG: hypothetical protein AAF787_01920 [Chloroflexota bacterium]
MRNLLRAIWQNPVYFLVAAVSLIFPAAVIRYMTLYNRQNAPIFDDYLYNASTAIAARAGTLDYAQVIGLGNGIHTYLFSTLTTIVNTWLFNWDVRIDAVVSFVVFLLLWGALLVLVSQHERRALVFAAVPLSALVLSLQKDFAWVIGILSIWAQSALLFTLALIVVSGKKPPTLLRLALIAAIVFCQVLVAVNGLAAWVVLAPALWYVGYRHWRHVALWVGAMVFSVVFFVNRPGFGAEEAAGGVELSAGAILASLPAYGRFILTYLGKPFIHTHIELAQQIAVVGLLVFVANAAYLLYVGQRCVVVIWGTMALQGFASGAMISVGRTDTWGLVQATAPWYLDMSLMFWAALVALMCISLVHLLQNPTPIKRAAAYATIGIALVAVPFHGYGVVMVVSFRENFTQAYTNHADCTHSIPVTGDTACSTLGLFNLHLTDELALFGLTIFSDRAYDSVLSEQYQPGSPVIIETASHWHTDAVKRLFLDNLPDSDGMYVVPPDEDHELIYNRIPRRNFTEQITAGDIDTLSARTGMIWHVRQQNLTNPNAFTLADSAPMFPIAYHAQFPFVGHDFDVTAYHTGPHDTAPDYNFGDDALQLLQWGIPADLTVAPCATLPLETIWATDAENIADDLHMTVVLSDENGVGLSRSDLPLSPGTSLWEAETMYFEGRTLEVPCETAPGTYPILLGVYDVETVTALPAKTMNGDTVGDLLFLTNAIVE